MQAAQSTSPADSASATEALRDHLRRLADELDRYLRNTTGSWRRSWTS
jgi:hypothetical protein